MERQFFIEKSKDKPLYVSLYEAIVHEILVDSLVKDEKMPSIRALAKSMNISRTTIESAYGQLVAEGYLYSKAQSGYFVMEIHKLEDSYTKSNLSSKGSDGDKALDQEVGQVYHKPHVDQDDMFCDGYLYDFKSEYVEDTNFDITMWKRNINKVLNLEDIKLFSQSESFGEKELQIEIANYFGRVRGIKANPSQIVIGGGIESLLRPLASYMTKSGFSEFAIENPGFNLAKEVFKNNEYKLTPIPLVNKTVDIECLSKLTRSICFLSPSYQFPYGDIMPVADRIQALEWAEETDSYIIEDDYNNELRYVGKPISSLQGMDRFGRVIYIGSFSTLLIPSIRISFMVLPLKIASEYKNFYRGKVQSSSKLEQLALASMLNGNDFSKHIRKLRIAYRNKNQKLQNMLTKYLGEYCDLYIPPAGVSVILELKKQVNKEGLLRLLNEHSLSLALLSEYSIEKEEKTLEKTLVLNYRGISEKDMLTGVKHIKEVLCQLY